MKYGLITPARNEERFIEQTIQSVIAQTIRPARWVIVNDGSTDATGLIARRHAALHGWIEVVDMPERRDRSFAAKVYSFNAGYERLKSLNYEVIGNLDADITFEPDFFAFLLAQIAEDSRLGVVGTVFREADGYSSETDSFEGERHVSGQCQLFRRECFEEIGGYVAHKAGGIDWIAVTTARMKGWKTRSFREKSFFHHRSLGTAERGKLRSAFSYGEKDYYLGNHPLWEACRVAYRIRKRPYLVGGIAVGLGYLCAACRRIDRPIGPELIQFHRREQMEKLAAIVKRLVTLRRIDTFRASPS